MYRSQFPLVIHKGHKVCFSFDLMSYKHRPSCYCVHFSRLTPFSERMFCFLAKKNVYEGFAMAFRPVKSRIPNLLKERNLDPINVYESIGMKKQQFSSYMNMRSICTIQTAKLIADFFGIPIDDLYEWEEY